MSNSLQDITDAWGRWMVTQHGGNKIKFTASTDYGKNKELSQYKQYEVKTELKGVSYSQDAPAPVDGHAYSKYLKYKNNTPSVQRINFTDSKTTDQSFSWSITESLSIGVSVSVTAGLPEVAQVTETINVDLSLSSTQGKTFSESQTWSVDWPVEISPKSVLTGRIAVATQTYNIDWVADVIMTNYVAIWFDQKVSLNGPNDFHWLWFIPISQVFRDCKDNQIIDIRGYVPGANNVAAQARGRFSGSQGVSSEVELDEEPLEKEAWAEHRRDFIVAAIPGE